MPNTSNIVRGKLVLQNLPDLACFTSFEDLLKALPEFLGVEIPSSITNVIVSNTQPTDSQTAALWIRLSNAGGFLGFYIFNAGAWHNIYPIQDSKNTQIQWFTSNDGSGDVPAGWTLIDGSTDTDIVPAAVATQLLTQYVSAGSNYIYFAAYFSGF